MLNTSDISLDHKSFTGASILLQVSVVYVWKCYLHSSPVAAPL